MCAIYMTKYKLNGEFHDNILASLSNEGKEEELKIVK